MNLQKQFLSFFWPVFCGSLLAFPFHLSWAEKSLSSKVLGAEVVGQLLFSSNMDPFWKPFNFLWDNSPGISASLCLSLNGCLPPACGWAGGFWSCRTESLSDVGAAAWWELHEGLIRDAGLYPWSFRPKQSHELKQVIWIDTLLCEMHATEIFATICCYYFIKTSSINL